MIFLITCGDAFYRARDPGIGGKLWTNSRESAERYTELPPCWNLDGWEIEPLEYTLEELEALAARAPFTFTPRFARQFE